MKLHFEPNLDYQHSAIEAVCDLFRGQEICRTEFTVTKDWGKQQPLPGYESDLGIGNRLTLLDDEILANLNDIQLRNGLAPSSDLSSGDFTVEMETGTGKTYVYLRTIFELNKRYGFNKFVIVVPSVAIKEGVYKSLQITEEHFRGLYAGVPFEFFTYDSSKPGPIRDFATSHHIRIMVVTVGAINKKDVNNLYKPTEKTGDEKPIELIRATRPILIVDEPQSVDGGLEGRGKEALGMMSPLCTLRYSATHTHKHHMVYRLDAVDAYERKLVKQIEVASANIEGAHNKPYVRFISSSNTRGTITAKVELDVQGASGVRRMEVSVRDGDDLQQTTKRPVYENCRIGEIRVGKEKGFLELRVPGGEVFLRPGETYSDVDQNAIQREMIRRTIKEHFEKEIRLAHQGIKVLSLFFIDSVDKYRMYDEDGNPVKGEYALIFEEEYSRLARHPDYQTLFKEVDITSNAEEVHNGYFSIDKKICTPFDTYDLKKSASKENVETDSYSLIMRDKEKLLSFETKLKFIFSHSALREGWDNPNVFQICALREMGTERERRQTIGRGLRLCVRAEGSDFIRVRGFDTNTLTVIATEGYEEFAENLQKEIEQDTGIRFGIVEEHQFAAIAIKGDDGVSQPLGFDKSKTLWGFLLQEGYIDRKGKIQDSLRKALKDETLVLPDEFKPHNMQVRGILRKLAGKLEVKDANKRQDILPRQAVLNSQEFKELWNRIKYHTTYRVQFDNDALLKTCVKAIKDAPPISKTRLQWRKADLAIGRAGVEANETVASAPIILEESDIELPDILTELQDKTQLTRRTIARALIDSGRLDDFKRNPQQYIEIAAHAINRAKRLAIVDGIKYQRLGDEYYYAQELFEEKELNGYLTSMLPVNRGVHEYVVYQSETERNFAEQLDKNESVKVFAKLPGWFQLPTPLGPYNPDWAVLIEQDGAERIYFVVETKSSLFDDDLRDKEGAKIDCGEAHFKALAVHENPAKFKRASKVEDLFG